MPYWKIGNFLPILLATFSSPIAAPRLMDFSGGADSKAPLTLDANYIVR